jgi:acyl carrier protein
VVVRLVFAQTAAVLGFGDPSQVEGDKEFLDMGFASLTAVQLVNRLNELTGLELEPAAVYDVPTPNELAEHVLAALDATRE